jgi:hypothetical protein
MSFSYDNVNVELVKKFNYLGIIFTRTGNFNLTKKHLADKALKTMYEVLKMGRMHKLSITCLLDIFDKMIKLILLYGCKVWGFSNNDIILEYFVCLPTISLAQQHKVLILISIYIGYRPSSPYTI